jgi:dynein heavy chain
MNGTCKECQPVKVENQDEPFLYTFFLDVANRSELREIASQIQMVLQKSFQHIKKHLNKFKKYKSLWKTDKVNFQNF